ncbi:MAG TPA: hypothetical protein PK022_07710 [Syntrophales bacterium]|nr:hypothetical protein [Syntrophales bacterium]
MLRNGAGLREAFTITAAAASRVLPSVVSRVVRLDIPLAASPRFRKGGMAQSKPKEQV